MTGMVKHKTELSDQIQGEDFQFKPNEELINKSLKNNNVNLNKSLGSTFSNHNVYIKDINDFARQAPKLNGNAINKIIRGLNPNFHQKTNFSTIKNLSNGVMLGSIKSGN